MLEHVSDEQKHLVTDPLDREFISSSARIYAKAIYDKIQGLERVIGFIDGTVFGIAGQKGNFTQRLVYNGHKPKHLLKYQAVNAPGGMMLHVAGLIEGCRHHWTLFVRSGLEGDLPDYRK